MAWFKRIKEKFKSEPALLLDREVCEFCDREIVDKEPKEAYTGKCGGKECGHRTIYGLIEEDCRQVVFLGNK